MSYDTNIGGKLKDSLEAVAYPLAFPPSRCELVLNKVKEDKNTQYSLRGVGSTLRPVSPTGWKRSRRTVFDHSNIPLF
jgi:hypothetical protein